MFGHFPGSARLTLRFNIPLHKRKKILSELGWLGCLGFVGLSELGWLGFVASSELGFVGMFGICGIGKD
jgi:hypothetical protein